MQLARDSIEHGLHHGRALTVELTGYPEQLRERRATFVTLRHRGGLRGCIGTLEAYQPLVADVAEHAFAAGFQDPRFPPLSPPELTALEVHVAILSPPEHLPCSNEAALLAELRPGVDGLILDSDHHRATFLPAVWDDLPEPNDFLAHLKRKAGLPAGYWSEQLRFRRYQVEEINEP